MVQRTIHIARVSAVDGDGLGSYFVAETTADCAAFERDEACGCEGEHAGEDEGEECGRHFLFVLE